MSPARRRRRRSRRDSSGGDAPAAESPPQPKGPALPEWRWRTLPVFFALSLGLFVGLYLGLLFADGGLARDIVLIVAAGMLGLSISRIFSRFLMRRRIIKPRARRG